MGPGLAIIMLLPMWMSFKVTMNHASQVGGSTGPVKAAPEAIETGNNLSQHSKVTLTGPPPEKMNVQRQVV